MKATCLKTTLTSRFCVGTRPFVLSIRILALFGISILLGGFARAQSSTGSFRWTIQAGGSGSSAGRVVAADSSGVVHLCGHISGTAKFGATNLTATSAVDGFVATFDQSGNLLWLSQMGGTGNNYLNGMAVDGGGDTFVTGPFGGTITIGSNSLTSTGGTTGYLAKYASNGNVLWVTSVGGSRVAVDGFGNAYVSGIFSGGSNNFSGVILTNFSATWDNFIAKFNGTNGNLLWVQRAGGDANGAIGQSSQGVAADVLGNSYILSTLNGNMKFGNANPTNIAGTNTFLAKYDTNGNLAWVQQFTGGVNNYSGSTGLACERGCAVDSAGNVYIASIFHGVAMCGSIALTNSAGYGVLVAKFDTDGNLIWAHQTIGTDTNDERNLAVDAQGNVLMTGLFNGTTTFGNTTLSTGGEQDIFVAKCDTDGNFLWAEQAGGSGADWGASIAVNSCGDAFVTGAFTGSGTFGNTNLTSLDGGTCIFLSRIDAESPSLSVFVTGNQAVISWPFSTSECFELYESASLGSTANWSAGSAVPTQVENSYVVTNQLSEGPMFYTLQRQPPY